MTIQEEAVSILRAWAYDFYACGEHEDGVKIIHDGNFTDDDGNENEYLPCYAVFIHRDSLSGDFPQHESVNGLIVHRPKEEACFFVWLDVANGEEMEINEPSNTELDIDKVYKIIIAINNRCNDF